MIGHARKSHIGQCISQTAVTLSNQEFGTFGSVLKMSSQNSSPWQVVRKGPIINKRDSLPNSPYRVLTSQHYLSIHQVYYQAGSQWAEPTGTVPGTTYFYFGDFITEFDAKIWTEPIWHWEGGTYCRYWRNGYALEQTWLRSWSFAIRSTAASNKRR